MYDGELCLYVCNYHNVPTVRIHALGPMYLSEAWRGKERGERERKN